MPDDFDMDAPWAITEWRCAYCGWQMTSAHPADVPPDTLECGRCHTVSAAPPPPPDDLRA